MCYAIIILLSTGNVGEDYRTEQKDIDGYTFKEVKGNPTGQFTDKAQTVTYMYTKDKVTSKPEDNKPSNGENTHKTGSSSSNSEALPGTGENERMTMMSIILGLVLLTLGVVASIFRFKKVDK